MKKILITGAAGYLGARLSKYLSENGNIITAFVKNDVEYNSEWAKLMNEIIVGDIRDENTISNLVENDYDVVVHLISLDRHKSKDTPNYVSSINVLPTWNLLNSFTKKGIDKFILFSTLEVLGNFSFIKIDEHIKPNPINYYGLTHLLSERIVDYFNNKSQTKCINIRLSNGYGSPVFMENNCWWLVINEFCKSAFNRQEITLISDGSPQRDFIYISDICRAIEIIIESENNFIENMYYLASGKTFTILELAHIVKGVFNKEYQKDTLIYFPDESISSDPYKFNSFDKFYIDTTKIRELGFTPEIGLENGIKKLFNYLNNS